MLKKILLSIAGVALVCALVSFAFYGGGNLEQESVTRGYTLGQPNHDHVKDISMNLKQNMDGVNQGINPVDLDQSIEFTGRTNQNSNNSKQSNKKVPDNAMESKSFSEYFFNVTNPNIQWKQWTNEGVLLTVSTDKPVYRPGDTADIRAYYFNYTDKAPVDCKIFSPNLEIIDSKDDITYSETFDYRKKCEDYSFVFNYKIPEDTKGGVYYVKINDYQVPNAVTKIRIRSYQQKSIVKLDYSQETFNPGDDVTGKLTYELVDDMDIPHGAYFELATSAGHSLTGLSISGEGTGFFNFKIPDDWSEGSIFLTFTIHIGSKVETKSDIITVVQKDDLVIEFTGESGKIIKDVNNRIFFECFTDESRSEHADISNAELIELKSNTVIAQGVSTMFNGRGYFEFTPKSGQKYVLRHKGVDHQVDIDQYNKDLSVENHDSEARILIKTKESVVKNEDNLDLTLVKPQSDKKLDLILAISQKSHILYSQKVSLKNQETNVLVNVKKLGLINGGVISISLYDSRAIIQIEDSRNVYYGDAVANFPYQSIANRLAFILPSETLQINLETDKKAYSPGQKVKYDITVTDKKTGKKVNDDVYVALSVTDLSAFLQVEPKRQPPSLVSKVYLEKEVNLTSEYEFLNSNEYMNHLYQITDNANDDKDVAKLKLELLLGTQKWRLFAFDPIYKQNNSGLMYGPSSKLSESQQSYSFNNLWVESNDIMAFGAMEDMALDMPVMARAGGGMVANEAIRFKGAIQPMAEMAAMEAEDDIGGAPSDEDEADGADGEDETEEPGDDSMIAERVNFKETQLFTKFIKTKKGKYSDSFKLGDLITKFQFSIDAVSSKGVYGAFTSTFNSNKEFYIESKLPLFLTNGDKISVPIVITNNKAKEVYVTLTADTSLNVKALEHKILDTQVSVPAHSTKSVILELKARQQTKDYFNVKISAKTNDGSSDSFTKKTRIIGRGFPVTLSKSGFLGKVGDKWTESTTLPIQLPPTYEPGTLEARAKVFTSQLSHIHEALEKLIRDPHGCFEQTSSTTYPLVMALILMKNLPEKTPEISKMMMEGTKKLQAGYDKLLTFETSDGGYEWFGESPGLEALSAYGLMQFHEMKEVLSGVDQTMIDRVTDWVLSKRDGKGSFKVKESGLDSFARPPPDLSDAYILWVLTSIGKDSGLEKEIKTAIEKAKASGDTYLNALVSNILYNVNRDQEAKNVAKILASHQDSKTGEVSNSETTITRSAGSSLRIETTALSTLAWMKDKSGDFASNIELGVKYIVSSIKDGKYGSTQGTILSLKVLVEFLKNSKLEGEGSFNVFIDTTSITDSLSIPGGKDQFKFTKNSNTSSIDFNDILETYLDDHQTSFLKHSNHDLKLTLDNFQGNEEKFRISYAMEAVFKDLSPTSNPDSDLEFTLGKRTEKHNSKIGDISKFDVKIHNKDQDTGKGMLIAMIRIPSCQELDYNWLERLQSSKKIAYFEVLNDNTDVVLYWRSIGANETKEVSIQLTQVYNYDQCIFRPSKAYLYYDEDGSQVWTS